MHEQFNPYYHWLGIPLEEQPPSLYRLLGVPPLEPNPAVIQGAADHWLAQLQPYRQGPYGPYAERLAREIWNARQCLLDPRSKAGYDAQLYQAMQAQAAAAYAPDVTVDASIFAGRNVPPPLPRRTSAWQQALVLVLALGACGLAVALLLMALRGEPQPAPQVAQDDGLGTAVAGPKPASRPLPAAPSEVHLTVVPGAAKDPAGGKFDLASALSVRDATVKGGFKGDGAAASSTSTAAGTTSAAAAPAKPTRKAPPDEAAQAAATTALKETYAKELARTESISQVALAAQWIEKARTLRDKPTEQYTLLLRARELAAREDQCQLALLAIDEMARDFEVSGPELKVAVLAQLGRPARSVSSLLALLDAGAQVSRESFGTPLFEKLLAAVRAWELGALRKGSPALAQGLADLRKRLEELVPLSQQALEAASANTPAALWEQALAASVFREDWDQALPLLARTGHPELSKAAAGVVAEPKNARAFLALGDAWWTVSEAERNATVVKPRMQHAARYWYEKALPRLVEEELLRARERVMIASGAKLGAKTAPFTLALRGLADQVSVAPTKVTGNPTAAGGFATLAGAATIEYPPLPTAAYIHDLELTFNGSGGALALRYGDPCQGISLDFTAAGEGYSGRLTHYHPKGTKSFRTKTFEANKKITVTVYVNESRQAAWSEKAEFSETAAAPADLALHIVNRGKAPVSIAKCEMRPFEAGDADGLRWPRPVGKGHGRGEEAALRWYSRNLGLTERAALNTPAPFVVAATGTPMQWIAPGGFKHVNYGAQPEERLDPTRTTIPRGFWLGRCEITQREWLALMPHNPARIVGSPFYPVDGVSWEEALAFCNLVQQHEANAKRVPPGYVYRLPTEAEWEMACQGGSGEEFAVESAGFWCLDTSDWRLHEAGEGKPNALGLYDMHGNVAEWCLDAWQDAPLLPPQTLTDPFFRSPDPKNIFFVLRGGGWWSLRRDCSASVRQQYCSAPGGHRGFRIALAPAR